MSLLRHAARHGDGAASARKILGRIIRIKEQQYDARMVRPLTIQRGLVDERKRPDETTAGRVVMEAAAREFAEAKEKVEALKY